MIKKLNGFTVIVVVALLVVLGAVGFVKAIDGSPTYIIENIEQADFTIEVASLGDFEDSMNLGASGTRFPNGVSADSTSPIAGELRGTTLTLTGAAAISGDVTLTGNLDLDGATTTPGKRQYRPISIDLALPSSTSTAEATTLVLGNYCNTGSPVDYDIETWALHLETAAGTLGTTALTFGTTTVADISTDWALGTNSFAATSTATLGSLWLASSTTGWFDLAGIDKGIYDQVDSDTATSTRGTVYYSQGGNNHNTTTPRTLATGDCIVLGWNANSATSSGSLATGGGNLIDGNFYMDAWAH